MEYTGCWKTHVVRDSNLHWHADIDWGISLLIFDRIDMASDAQRAALPWRTKGYASFHMQKRISFQSWSTVIPCTGRNGVDDVGEVGGCAAAAGKSWETVQLTSRQARALRCQAVRRYTKVSGE